MSSNDKDENTDDGFFPGFIEEEADTKPAKAKPPVPPPPPAAADDEPFDPFADEGAVEVPALVPDPAVPLPNHDAAPAAPRPEQPPAAGGGFDAFAGSQEDGEEPDDAELKPGSRKDLWICPHCGAGNRPGRDTCRTCGKSPNEPVIQPWFKQPKFIAGMAGGALLLVILLMMLSGPSFSLSPATLSSIDNDLRQDRSLSGFIDVDDDTFLRFGRFAAAGRVVTASSRDGHTHLVLAFGDHARNLNLRFIDRGGDEVGFTNNLGSLTRVPYVRLAIIDDGGLIDAIPRGGAVVSLTGIHGEIVDGLASDPANRSYVIRLTAWRSAQP